MAKNKKDIEFTENDYQYMQSLSAAILEKTPSKISRVIKIWLFTILAAIIWASFASIDEITRGDGSVIPYGSNQVIQNLEGGIVEAILIKEGQNVTEGQTILKIRNAKSISTSQSNIIKYEELKAKRLRLHAEANQLPFEMPSDANEENRKHLELERKLYETNMKEFEAKDNSIAQQIEQRKQEHKEAKAKIVSLQKSLEYVSQEIAMTEPMVKEGIKSKVDFLKLKREASTIENEIQAAKLSLPRLLSAIEEYKEKRIESKQVFIKEAKEELNEVTAELSRLEAQQLAYNDQVDRTMVKSPVNGIIQKLYVNTIGGVIKPGEDIIEIVPTNKKLWLEIKIKPSDIAFIHPGAEAKVKISAYDFAIHGGLIGKVVDISPDTITDENDNTFYLIHVETQKNYLGSKEHPLKIIPGMMASVDIVTGKKTVMQYILKPILKSKQYVFSER
ncbi:MAG: HlyD family type I secretion periplasmic adaptor subunit [Campylobacterales bacterium]|nr:HlyD family type I secretion periplasmic adaptor subunit [Campylobacterales bacterium]